MSEKNRENPHKIEKKLHEDAMLWSDRRRLITKTHFLPSCILLNVGIDPNFPQTSFFSLFWLYSEKNNFAFQLKHF